MHSLFRREALRFYYAEVEPLRNNFTDVISKMMSQFNSISKQQCVKAELSGLRFQDMVDKSDRYRRKALRDLVASIEARNQKKVEFFRKAHLAKGRARQHLYSIGKGVHFRELQT